MCSACPSLRPRLIAARWSTCSAMRARIVSSSSCASSVPSRAGRSCSRHFGHSIANVLTAAPVTCARAAVSWTNWTVRSDTLRRDERLDIVDELNRLMAEEAEACLRYFQLRYRLRGIDREAAEQ